MAEVLLLLILSFICTSVALVPFINFLYRMKFQRQVQETKDIFNNRTPIFDSLHSWKAGVPVGGGILLIIVLLILPAVGYTILDAKWNSKIFIILATMVLFGILGFYDDSKKFFNTDKTEFFGLRFRHKFIIQWVLALAISYFIYQVLDFHRVNILWNIVSFDLSTLFIPFAAFVIVSFTNAVNITDGLDGLATGLLIICLIAFLILSRETLNSTLSAFIGAWIGALFAFLYFNIYPARVYLGDVGALSFGATLAVVGLLTGKVAALAVIGGVFVIEIASTLLQLLSKKYLGRKLFAVAPMHLFLQLKGWQEPRIVMRLWLAGAMFAMIGLLIAIAK